MKELFQSDCEVNYLKARTLAECQNGHKAYWYFNIDGLGEVINIGVKNGEKCDCPKWDIGQGYSACGKVEIYNEDKDAWE